MEEDAEESSVSSLGMGALSVTPEKPAPTPRARRPDNVQADDPLASTGPFKVQHASGTNSPRFQPPPLAATVPVAATQQVPAEEEEESALMQTLRGARNIAELQHVMKTEGGVYPLDQEDVRDYVDSLGTVVSVVGEYSVDYMCPVSRTMERAVASKVQANSARSRLRKLRNEWRKVNEDLQALVGQRAEMFVDMAKLEVECDVYEQYLTEMEQERNCSGTVKVKMHEERKKLQKKMKKELRETLRATLKAAGLKRKHEETDSDSEEEPTQEDRDFIAPEDEEEPKRKRKEQRTEQPAAEERFTLMVKFPGGKRTTFRFSPTDHVIDAKEALAPNGVEAEQVRLHFKGKQLRDAYSLAAEGVVDGSVLIMTLQTVGGGDSGAKIYMPDGVVLVPNAPPARRQPACTCSDLHEWVPLCPRHREPGSLGQVLVRAIHRWAGLIAHHRSVMPDVPLPAFPKRNGASIKNFARTVAAASRAIRSTIADHEARSSAMARAFDPADFDEAISPDPNEIVDVIVAAVQSARELDLQMERDFPILPRRELPYASECASLEEYLEKIKQHAMAQIAALSTVETSG